MRDNLFVRLLCVELTLCLVVLVPIGHTSPVRPAAEHVNEPLSIHNVDQNGQPAFRNENTDRNNDDREPTIEPGLVRVKRKAPETDDSVPVENDINPAEKTGEEVASTDPYEPMTQTDSPPADIDSSISEVTEEDDDNDDDDKENKDDQAANVETSPAETTSQATEEQNTEVSSEPNSYQEQSVENQETIHSANQADSVSPESPSEQNSNDPNTETEQVDRAEQTTQEHNPSDSTAATGNTEPQQQSGETVPVPEQPADTSPEAEIHSEDSVEGSQPAEPSLDNASPDSGSSEEVQTETADGTGAPGSENSDAEGDMDSSSIAPDAEAVQPVDTTQEGPGEPEQMQEETSSDETKSELGEVQSKLDGENSNRLEPASDRLGVPDEAPGPTADPAQQETVASEVAGSEHALEGGSVSEATDTKVGDAENESESTSHAVGENVETLPSVPESELILNADPNKPESEPSKDDSSENTIPENAVISDNSETSEVKLDSENESADAKDNIENVSGTSDTEETSNADPTQQESEPSKDNSSENTIPDNAVIGGDNSETNILTPDSESGSTDAGNPSNVPETEPAPNADSTHQESEASKDDSAENTIPEASLSEGDHSETGDADVVSESESPNAGQEFYSPPNVPDVEAPPADDTVQQQTGALDLIKAESHEAVTPSEASEQSSENPPVSLDSSRLPSEGHVAENEQGTENTPAPEPPIVDGLPNEDTTAERDNMNPDGGSEPITRVESAPGETNVEDVATAENVDESVENIQPQGETEMQPGTEENSDSQGVAVDQGEHVQSTIETEPQTGDASPADKAVESSSDGIVQVEDPSLVSADREPEQYPQAEIVPGETEHNLQPGSESSVSTESPTDSSSIHHQPVPDMGAESNQPSTPTVEDPRRPDEATRLEEQPAFPENTYTSIDDSRQSESDNSQGSYPYARVDESHDGTWNPDDTYRPAEVDPEQGTQTSAEQNVPESTDASQAIGGLNTVEQTGEVIPVHSGQSVRESNDIVRDNVDAQIIDHSSTVTDSPIEQDHSKPNSGRRTRFGIWLPLISISFVLLQPLHR